MGLAGASPRAWQVIVTSRLAVRAIRIVRVVLVVQPGDGLGEGHRRKGWGVDLGAKSDPWSKRAAVLRVAAATSRADPYS